jgi:hypothetical protein
MIVESHLHQYITLEWILETISWYNLVALNVLDVTWWAKGYLT